MVSLVRVLIVLVFVLVLWTTLGSVSTSTAYHSATFSLSPGSITRVSVSSSGTQANNHSYSPAISTDGRYVAFESTATNLVGGSNNGRSHIYVHDRQTGQTTRVSVDSDGIQANQNSNWASVSADGRYVVFESDATNLVGSDTNGKEDIFVHDRQTSQTTRISVASDGTQGNDDSVRPSISGDGRYVAFYSEANNLVLGDTNGHSDVFVHDRQTEQTTRVSVSSAGVQGNNESFVPRISANGRYVAFESYASNLVSGDGNASQDVFVHDRELGLTTLVSMTNLGASGDNRSISPSINADGRYVAFLSTATNLVSNDTNSYDDIFVHDRGSQTTRVSVASDGAQGNGQSWSPSISGDGRYVTFRSSAANLVSADTNAKFDIFVHDRQTNQTTRISIASNGAQGDDDSSGPAISTDGRYVAFYSQATNLVGGDTNGKYDIFVYDRDGEPRRIYLPLILR
ncbi:MAG: PD40 domain-containing protein [Chloroflexi bacterium]|nr:PD40 domain-containing protein [Chloroflexota bacterium]